MRSPARRRLALLLLASWVAMATACGGGSRDGDSSGGAGPGARGSATGTSPPSGRRGGESGQPATAAVPVEIAAVERRGISSYIETNGTLEAENEVDIVARVAAPVIQLAVEEGMKVAEGQRLARLDDRELRARADISRVNLTEAELAFERAQALRDNQLLSPEEFERALTRLETARAQFESDAIQLGYTEIRAPFAGLIVARYVDLAEQVSPGAALFRISDFTPLLCPIQVPERDLPKLRSGQPAYLTLEAWPGERFRARVLRIRPVVDAATGTVRVTLEVDAGDRLRPGMFARVFLETETRDQALVIPKAALSLESIGDTVYVASDGVAERRSVALGFREGDFVEVLSGVGEGEQVVVVGQDGLSDGTPIAVLAAGAAAEASGGRATARSGSDGVSSAGRSLDVSRMTPEELERARAMMRARGLSEQQIEERLGQTQAGQDREPPRQ